MGEWHAKEIVTGYAQTTGTMVLELWELYREEAWVTLFKEVGMTFSNDASNIKELFDAQRAYFAAGKTLEIQKLIGDYDSIVGDGGSLSKTARVKNYMGATITGADTSESVAVSSVEKTVKITIMYTHTT